MKKFVELQNVLGDSNATETTVALFNSCRPLLRDKHGVYVERAIEPYKNGVIVIKEYQNEPK